MSDPVSPAVCPHGIPLTMECSECARLQALGTAIRGGIEMLSRPVDPAPVDPMAVQVGGDHYKSMAIQPMEYSMANGLDACQHTIIKYVSRFRAKGGVKDLEKARHTLDMLIAFEKKAGR
jgi:hypothetical protein